MKLNTEEISDMAEKIRRGEASKAELKKLIGGDQLDEIVDEAGVEGILDAIINDGKIHVLLQGDGFDILEGLLNKRINGDLSSFYCIKPEYIVGLPKEEQEKMATAFAGNKKELHDMLVFLWSKGIMTRAVDPSCKDPIILFTVLEDDLNSAILIQQIYEHNGIEGDVIYASEEWLETYDGPKNTLYHPGDSLSHVRHYYPGRFDITLNGKNLYTYNSESAIGKNRIGRENIFEQALNESLNVQQSYLPDITAEEQRLEKYRDLKSRVEKAGENVLDEDTKELLRDEDVYLIHLIDDRKLLMEIITEHITMSEEYIKKSRDRIAEAEQKLRDFQSKWNEGIKTSYTAVTEEKFRKIAYGAKPLNKQLGTKQPEGEEPGD